MFAMDAAMTLVRLTDNQGTNEHIPDLVSAVLACPALVLMTHIFS